MSSLVPTIQAIVQQELRRLRTAELGLVEEVYPHAADDDQDNYGCDVRLKNSGLLLERVPVATGRIGTVAIPNVGDLVLLNFDHGDVNQPIVVGRLYNDQDRPPLSTTDEVIFRLPLAEADEETVKASVRNHQDQSPPREVRLELAPKIELEVNDGTVRATAGKTEMKLDQPGSSGGTVTVFAGATKLTMNQDGDLTVEGAASMTLSARGSLTLEGQSVTIKSRTSASIEAGTQATLKANTGATVNGGVSSTVQGAMVNVKGVTSFSP